jgi:acylpyruvate hydrolase
LQRFSPTGPCVATLDEIAAPDNLTVTTWLNDAKMQDAWTKDLIWSVPEQIAYYSRWDPVQPGDVLTTGSPDGIGDGREPEVSGVGRLENPIVAAVPGRG